MVLYVKAGLGLAAALLAAVPTIPNLTTLPTTTTSDFEIGAAYADATTPGGDTVVRIIAANLGPNRTTRAFTVLVTLPPQLTGTGGMYPDDCTHDPDYRVVSCRFPAGLNPYRDASVTIPAKVDPDVLPGDLPGGTARVFSSEDLHLVNNFATYAVPVGASPTRR